MEKKRLFVSLEDKSVRMFDNNFLDFFSRVHWTVPIWIYIPLVTYCWYVSLTTTNLSLLAQVGYFALGIFIWTLFEYVMHRFVFHYQPKTELGKKIHFMTHGVHHDYPQDSMRLVMPPPISIPIAIVTYTLFRLVAGYDACWTLFGGFTIAYLAYDILHYATHHFSFGGSWFRELKRHHMDHHYRDDQRGFGVTSKFWDIIFGSGFKSDKSDKK